MWRDVCNLNENIFENPRIHNPIVKAKWHIWWLETVQSQVDFFFLSRKSNITYEEFPFYISHWINELWLQPLGHHSTDLLGASVLIFFSINRLHYIPFSQVFAVFDVSARGNLLRYGGKLSTRTSHARPNKTRKEIIWLTQSVFFFFFLTFSFAPLGC